MTGELESAAEQVLAEQVLAEASERRRKSAPRPAPRLNVDLDAMMATARAAHESLGLAPSADDVDDVARERKAIAAAALACFPAVPWARFGDLEFVKKCEPRIRQALGNWKRGSGHLALLGPTGCGKTIGLVAAAARMLDVAARAGGKPWGFARRIGFTTAARLARARREHGLGEGDAPLVQRACSFSLLFLDELGYLDGDRDTTVAEVICERDYRNLPTIVTSGLTAAGLDDRYGAATVRKLTERGQIVSVHQ